MAVEEAAARLEQPRDRVDDGDGVQPAAQERERHVDGSEEENQEDRQLHHRPGLDRPQPHRNAARPEQRREVEDEPERVEGDQVDAVAPHVHVRDQRDAREDADGERPPAERRERVADHNCAPVRGRDEEPAREAVLEVARDREADEDALERRRLEQDEHELEGRVAGRVVEPGQMADLLQTAREGGEEEEREEQRGKEQGGRREDVVQDAPRDAEGNGPEAAHVRVILPRRAPADAARESTAMATATANASASAWPFQPSMIRLRTPSSR